MTDNKEVSEKLIPPAPRCGPRPFTRPRAAMLFRNLFILETESVYPHGILPKKPPVQMVGRGLEDKFVKF